MVRAVPKGPGGQHELRHGSVWDTAAEGLAGATTQGALRAPGRHEVAQYVDGPAKSYSPSDGLTLGDRATADNRLLLTPPAPVHPLRQREHPVTPGTRRTTRTDGWSPCGVLGRLRGKNNEGQVTPNTLM